jgi:hypothetical protein
MPCLSELHRVLAGTLQLGLDRSLRPSTRRTYRTGVSAWLRFCARFNVPDNLFTGAYPRADVQRVTAYFVAYLRAGHGDSLTGEVEPSLSQLKGSTIDQYVSHVVKHIFEREYVDDASSYFRTARTAAVILGFNNDDRRVAPQRDTCKIPFSASLMVTALRLSRSLYGGVNPTLQHGIDAAFAVGFALCLRPGEYLFNTSITALDHVLVGNYAVFKWAEDPRFYSCLNPELYPSHLGPPAYFIQLPSTSKNDLWCKGGPMAVARAPPSSPFCCVLIIYSFLCLYPPAPGQPLLSGSPTTLSVSLVNSHCKKVAVTEGLDPARLLPHSLRVGSVNQIESHGIHAQQLHGRWNTAEGLSAYTHAALAHARRVSPELHNVDLLPAEFLRFAYMTPNVPTPASWRPSA